MTPGVVLAVQDSITSCVPEPERATDCGLPLALSVMLRVAVRAPLATGVNKTAMVQLLPAATEDPQVSTSEKSPGSVPAKAIPETVKVALPVLLKVTTCEELVVSTATLPKDRLEGEKLVAAAVPVPLRLTLCGLPDALSVRVTEAVKAPAAAGLKVTLIVQLAPEATLDPQVLVSAKSLALVPETAMLLTLKAPFPELVSVMV